MTFPPSAYIIGAQKAGTTTLAFLMNQHPRIGLSNPKEPHFFSSEWHRGVDWYRGCFDSEEGVLLDASTSYTMAPVDKTGRADDSVPRRLAALQPEARFIYVLRDPAERMFSAYWHNVRAGYERRGLREAVLANAGYRDPSCYVAQIQAFFRHFPPESFLFVDFRDLTRDPLAVTRTCLSFLGLADEEVPLKPSPPRNQSFQYSAFGRLVRRLLGGEKGMKTLSLYARRLPAFTHAPLKRLVSTSNPVLTPADRLWLRDKVAAHNAGLKDLVGFDFS